MNEKSDVSSPVMLCISDYFNIPIFKIILIKKLIDFSGPCERFPCEIIPSPSLYPNRRNLCQNLTQKVIIQ
jgi:hypothetical protein